MELKETYCSINGSYCLIFSDFYYSIFNITSSDFFTSKIVKLHHSQNFYSKYQILSSRNFPKQPQQGASLIFRSNLIIFMPYFTRCTFYFPVDKVFALFVRKSGPLRGPHTSGRLLALFMGTHGPELVSFCRHASYNLDLYFHRHIDKQ